jgi:hypothetical protein
MSHYYHVNTDHAGFADFIAQAESTHKNNTRYELSIALLINNEAIVKVSNGIISTPVGLVNAIYAKADHDQVLALYYANGVQE